MFPIPCEQPNVPFEQRPVCPLAPSQRNPIAPAPSCRPPAHQARPRTKRTPGATLRLPRPAAPFLPRKRKPPFGLALAPPKRRALIGRFESSPRGAIGRAGQRLVRMRRARPSASLGTALRRRAGSAAAPRVRGTGGAFGGAGVAGT